MQLALLDLLCLIALVASMLCLLSLVWLKILVFAFLRLELEGPFG